MFRGQILWGIFIRSGLCICISFAACTSCWADINVQQPGTHLEFGTGAQSISEYRDVVLNERASANIFAAFSNSGFSTSVWASRGSITWHEAAFAYSHKFPLADVHIAYVNTGMPDEFGWGKHTGRLTLSNNLSEETQVMVSLDRPIGSDGQRGYSASITQRVGRITSASMDVAIRGSFTSMETPQASPEGGSVRIIASRPLGNDILLGAFAALTRSTLDKNLFDRHLSPFLGISITKNF